MSGSIGGVGASSAVAPSAAVSPAAGGHASADSKGSAAKMLFSGKPKIAINSMLFLEILLDIMLKANKSLHDMIKANQAYTAANKSAASVGAQAPTSNGTTGTTA